MGKARQPDRPVAEAYRAAQALWAVASVARGLYSCGNFHPPGEHIDYTKDHLPENAEVATRASRAARMAFSSLDMRSLCKYGVNALSRLRC